MNGNGGAEPVRCGAYCAEGARLTAIELEQTHGTARDDRQDGALVAIRNDGLETKRQARGARIEAAKARAEAAFAHQAAVRAANLVGEVGDQEQGIPATGLTRLVLNVANNVTAIAKAVSEQSPPATPPSDPPAFSMAGMALVDCLDDESENTGRIQLRSEAILAKRAAEQDAVAHKLRAEAEAKRAKRWKAATVAVAAGTLSLLAAAFAFGKVALELLK